MKIQERIRTWLKPSYQAWPDEGGDTAGPSAPPTDASNLKLDDNSWRIRLFSLILLVLGIATQIVCVMSLVAIIQWRRVGLTYGLEEALSLWRTALIGVLAFVSLLLPYELVQKGRRRLATWLLMAWLLLVLIGAQGVWGVGHAYVVGYAVIVLIATLLSGFASGVVASLVCGGVYILLGASRTLDLLSTSLEKLFPGFATLAGASRLQASVSVWDGVLLTLFLLLLTCVVWSFIFIVDKLLQRLKESEQEAYQLVADREAAISERTRALQEANLTFQRRAMYLDASVQVSQALSTLFELDNLLDRAANLVTQYFGFYHTGIFLIDAVGGEASEWAILRAASSEGGRQMLANGHRLRRGEDSMVGWVMENRQSRIAADVGEDAHHFANPYLPATHSEATLPLLSGGRLIGVLDVQSTEEAAFDKDDVRALQGLAGQLAVAINNAQRLRDEAALLEAASPFYRLARRLATARTDRDVYAAMLDTVRDYSPNRAFVASPTSAIGYHALSDGQTAAEFALGAHLVADLRADELFFPEPVPLSAEERSEASKSLDVLEQESTAQVIKVLVELTEALDDVVLIDDFSALSDERDEEVELFAQIPESYHERLAELGPTLGARSLAAIPIRTEDRLLRLLVVSYFSLHRFSAIEQQLYRALADLVGVALERTHLVREAQQQAEEIGVLYRGSQAMAGARNLADILQVFVDYLVSPKIDRCVLALIDSHSQPDEPIAEIVAAWERPEPGSDEPKPSKVLGNRWSVSQIPLIAELMNRSEAAALEETSQERGGGSEPVVIPDVTTSPLLDDISRHVFHHILEIRAVVVVPIVAAGKVLGWLLAESLSEPCEFMEQEVRLYRALTDQAAIAIQSLRLIETTRQQAERERLISEISTKMRETLDVDTVMRVAAAEIGKALQVQDLVVRLGHDSQRADLEGPTD